MRKIRINCYKKHSFKKKKNTNLFIANSYFFLKTVMHVFFTAIDSPRYFVHKKCRGKIIDG